MYLKLKEGLRSPVHCRYGKNYEETYSVGPEAKELPDNVGVYMLAMFTSLLEKVQPVPETAIEGEVGPGPEIKTPVKAEITTAEKRIVAFDFECPVCHRNCHSRIGLERHKETHEQVKNA